MSKRLLRNRRAVTVFYGSGSAGGIKRFYPYSSMNWVSSRLNFSRSS